MSSKQKIAKVLKKIKDKSEISPNPKYVEFKFLPGAGLINNDEKKKILLKLQKEGIIKIHLPGKNEEEDAMLSCYTPEEFMLQKSSNLTLIEILYGFNKKYLFYKFYLKGTNYWKIFHPAWWIVFAIITLWKFLKLIWKHKIISLITTFIITLLALLAVNYPMVWKNLNYIIDFLKG